MDIDLDYINPDGLEENEEGGNQTHSDIDRDREAQKDKYRGK